MAHTEKKLTNPDKLTRLPPMDNQIFNGELQAQRALSVLGVASLLDWQMQEGHSRAELLTGTGIPSGLLDDPNALISPQQDMAFSRRLLALSGNPAIGLQAGQHFRLSSFGHLGMALPYAATRRDVATLLMRYINLTYTHFTTVLEIGATLGTVRFSGGEHLNGLRRYYLDRDLAFVVTVAREVLGGANPTLITAVRLAYPAPTDRRPYDDFFGVPVQHGAAQSCVEFDARGLDQPMPQANLLALRLIEPECTQRQARVLAGSPHPWTQRIQQALASTEDNHYPTMAQMAVRFHCTDRTLRRHLRQEGQTYQALLNAARAARATGLLCNTVQSIEHIADQLGYSEAAGFSRAFAQWFGISPLKYRQRASGHPAR
ncbi:MAG: AraC family transcriptional regulator [Rhodoferax sp.]